MSAALVTLRSSLARSTASASGRLRHRAKCVKIAQTARSISSLHRPSPLGNPSVPAAGLAGRHDDFATIRMRSIATSAPLQKSAVPIDDDDDSDDGPITASTPFLLADIGEGISEVELLQWFVSPGDDVSQFDRICEVQSDKASVEITSRFDGTVESLCGKVGDMMLVGKPLLYIATAGGAAAAGGGRGAAATASSASGPQQQKLTQQTPATLNNVDDEQDRLRIPSVGSNYSSYYEGGGAEQPSAPGARSSSGGNAKVLTSPAVRKLGKENNIDLSTVLGSGPGGRVLKADVLKIIGSTTSSKPSADEVKKAIPSSAAKPSTAPPARLEDDTVIPIRGYNRLMVKSMTSSLQVPHMVYADEINVNALTEVRDSLRPLAREMGVPKLTYLPFFIKAASLALGRYPVLNSTIDVEEMTLTYHAEHRIGVAVDTDRGLAVPVVKGCQDRSVLEIAEELNRLYALAIDGNLTEADIDSPTFTLSNIGAIGGTYMSPVVLPPQVAIGAMGKIQRLPRFVDDDSDEVEAARIMPISWGGDHRAVDGATMARFSNLWKSYCENPSSMMFAMR